MAHLDRAALLGLLAVVAGCGGSPPADAEEPAPAAAAGSEEVALVWSEDLTFQQQKRFMAENVVPRMGEVFRELDAEEFAEIRCSTCHGENAEEVHFEMPNDLHPLVLSEIPAMFTSEDEHLRTTATFMAERVGPTMAELLGVEPYSEVTGTGFGCLDCHATATD
ncbi:MAG: hypothetical protein ACFCGT_10785 [Sandaracinaceae bacterium]